MSSPLPLLTVHSPSSVLRSLSTASSARKAVAVASTPASASVIPPGFHRIASTPLTSTLVVNPTTAPGQPRGGLRSDQVVCTSSLPFVNRSPRTGGVDAFGLPQKDVIDSRGGPGSATSPVLRGEFVRSPSSLTAP